MRKNLVKLLPEFVFISLLAIIIFTPIVSHLVFYAGPNSDYSIHINYTSAMISTHEILLPHFLWHLSVIFIAIISQLSLGIAAIIVTVICFIALGLTIDYLLIVQYSTGIEVFSVKRVSIRIISVVSLMICTPVFLFYPIDHLAYLGYIGMRSYHNPTILICLPLSLLLFYFVVKYYNAQTCSTYQIAGIAILTIVSSLAKPVYLICLIPGLTLIVLYDYLSHQDVKWNLILGGVMIPGLIILFCQVFILNYINPVLHNSFIISPLTVMSNYGDNLLPKFLLSILFPLFVYLFYYKEITKNRYINYSWIVFFFGTFYTYFFAESGYRLYHGNFGWSAEISLFILFIFSFFFFIEKLQSAEKRNELRNYVLFTIFGLHVTFGILYYFIVFNSLRW